MQDINHLYQIIFNNSSIAIIVVEQDLTILKVNRQFERLSGFKKEDIEYKKLLTEFIEKTDLDIWEKYQQLQKNDKNSSSINYVFCFLNKNDGVKKLLASMVEIPDTKKHIISLIDAAEYEYSCPKSPKSERLYRLLVENVSDFIWTMDLNLHFTYTNASATSLLGYKPSDTKNLILNKLLTPASYELATKVLEEELARKSIEETDISRSQTLELEIIHKNGTVVWTESKMKFLRNSGNRPISILGVTRDITERKQIEKALKRSEERYRAIVESQTNLVFRWRPDKKLTFVNEAYCRYFGEKRKDLVGHRFINYIPKKDREKLKKHIASLTLQNPVGTIEHRIIENNGEIHWHQWTDRAIPDEQGRIVEFQSVGRDITDRKRTEEALRKSVRLLTEIINFLPDATFAIDIEGKVIAWNRAIVKMTGVKAKDMLGKGNYEYSLPFYGIKNPVLIDFILNPKDNIENKYHIIRKEKDVLIVETDALWIKGKKMFLWGKASPIYDYSGNVIGAIESIRDITDRKQMEDALRSSEKQLRFLSSQLLTAQEVERKRIASELHDSIGQTLTAVKFGIENALNFIEKDEKSSAVKTMESLIPAIQNGIREVRTICTDLRPSILDNLGILSTISWFCREFQVIYRNIQITQQIDIQENDIPQHIKIVLYRILQEATNNAAKYSHASLIHLILKKTDDTIHLTVKDNGNGFDITDTLSTNRPNGGFGIASMKERAENSGGAFAIESRKGTGTVIRASWSIER